MLRAGGNLLNLSTPLGVAVAAVGGARLRRGPDGLVLAERYRLRLPSAGAFTVGNVVIVPGTVLDQVVARCPGTLSHEAAHSWQWFGCLGLPFLPLYALASGWSWLRTGDVAAGNVFEVAAGLERGGYRARPKDNAGWHRLTGRAATRP